MEEQLKEIEGLLETTTRTEEDEIATPLSNIKKYIKLAFPHVALVAVVCLYATIGAFIFYRLESPNEDRLKRMGKESITELRSKLISQISIHEDDDWRGNVEQELMKYTDQLYKSFKEQYVRYSDVKHIGYETRTNQNSQEEEGEEDDESDRKRRHRHGGKGRGTNGEGEKMWTTSSALFFAATTMATIGYGNIVPATPSGRIACVIFALFGAPLAIITIGDLGKFLSECTIWLYKQMRKSGTQFQDFVRRIRGQEGSVSGTGTDIENGRKSSQDAEGSSVLDWEDLVIDKTEVPVIMVFTILLLYIAFGGILFSILENWSYMDAFYYSFISLTTIGFGDIVPENHDYILIMLIYLGVGLSVTTMCIDLVGIQYIQKIHYFGRKFRGTDLLHLLKRKRMIERRLAMGKGEDILRMYVQQIEKEVVEQIRQEEQEEQEIEVQPLEEKPINNSMMRIDDSLSEFQIRFYDTYDEEDLKSPTCHSVQSFQPSIWTQSSARSFVYSQFQRQRGDSWDESGPSLSEHCSLSTEPSVHIRQAYWDNYSSPTPSVISFLHRHLYSPSVASTISIDYENIATTTKGASRRSSCPPVPGQLPLPRFTDSPIGLACMQDWDCYIQMLEEASKRFQYPIEDEIEEEEDEEEIESESIPHEIVTSSSEIFSSTSADSSTLFYPLHFAPLVYYQQPASMLAEDCPMGNNYNSPPIIESISCDDFEMYPSPIPLEVQSSESEDEPIGVEVKEERLKPMNEIDLGAFELVDSGLTPEALLSKDEPVIFHQSMPVHSVHHDTVQTEAALANLMSAPSSMLTDGIPPIMVEDNYCFVVDGERVRMGDILGDDQWWRHTSRPTKYFYSEDLRQFHRVNCITAKGKVITAKLATQLTHQPSTSSMSTSMSQHTTLSSSSHAQIHPQHHSMSNTPRSSISGGTQQSAQTTPSRTSHHDANKVPLNNVYKVIRFYSFWKTCTSFHRIVTMIDKVVDEPSTTSEGGNTFKKRLFVQYLWRNAKAVEKARVQKEFDPRRQRLLRFVTDPAARKRFVEDEYFAVIVDENGNESESENDEDEDEEKKNNIDPQKSRKNQKIQVTMHPGKGGNIPIYSNDDEHPLDGPNTILHAVQCPKQFVATMPPSEVADTCCFVLDSNLVTMQMIEEDVDNSHWKQTMSTTHYYATDNWKDDFYRVTPLMCRGVVRGAYRIGKDKSHKIQKVEIFKVYRVTRHFSCWKTVPIFHRVLSLVEAALPYDQLTVKQRQLVRANGKKLINRLFIQYYWRNQQKTFLRDQIVSGYAETSKKCRAKKSWIRVVKNVQRLKEATDLLQHKK